MAGVSLADRFRAGPSALILLLGLVLGGCQTGTDDVLGVPDPSQIDKREVVGSGPVMLGVLLPRTAGGTTAADAADYRDGAALAARDLGGDQISMTIYDTGGSASEAGNLAVEAIGAGARLIIGPVGSADVASVATTTEGGRPPVLAFATNSATTQTDVFTMVSDEIDSAIAVADYAGAAGRKQVLAIVPKGLGATEIKRLKDGIGSGPATLVGIVECETGQSLEAQRELIGRASAVLLIADGKRPVPCAAAVRATGALGEGVPFLGTSGWRQEDFEQPAVSGALLALIDQRGLAQISERFDEAYKRPLTMQAAYGYDAVAVAAGIVRSVGVEQLTAATLKSELGFRGSTGLFRFDAEGKVERQFSIYQLEQGRLKLVDPAPAAF